MAKNSKDEELLEEARKGKVNVRDLITTFPYSRKCPTNEEDE